MSVIMPSDISQRAATTSRDHGYIPTEDVVSENTHPRFSGKTLRHSQEVHVVYFAKDAVGRIIYVGIARNWDVRSMWHRGTTPWWGEVDSVDTIHVEGRHRALDFERMMIEILQPKYNTQHTARDPRAAR